MLVNIPRLGFFFRDLLSFPVVGVVVGRLFKLLFWLPVCFSSLPLGGMKSVKCGAIQRCFVAPSGSRVAIARVRTHGLNFWPFLIVARWCREESCVCSSVVVLVGAGLFDLFLPLGALRPPPSQPHTLSVFCPQYYSPADGQSAHVGVRVRSL